MRFLRAKSSQDLHMDEIELECRRIIRTGRIATIEIKPEEEQREDNAKEYKDSDRDNKF